jgi:hypothetical protein
LPETLRVHSGGGIEVLFPNAETNTRYSKFLRSRHDDRPRILERGSLTKLPVELLQSKLIVNQAAEGASYENPAGDSEFGVAKVLNSNPSGRTEEDDDETAEPVMDKVLE